MVLYAVSQANWLILIGLTLVLMTFAFAMAIVTSVKGEPLASPNSRPRQHLSPS